MKITYRVVLFFFLTPISPPRRAQHGLATVAAGNAAAGQVHSLSF
jgi:hypothetical protein